jgi:hypothetical protein
MWAFLASINSKFVHCDFTTGQDSSEISAKILAYFINVQQKFDIFVASGGRAIWLCSEVYAPENSTRVTKSYICDLWFRPNKTEERSSGF